MSKRETITKNAIRQLSGSLAELKEDGASLSLSDLICLMDTIEALAADCRTDLEELEEFITENA